MKIRQHLKCFSNKEIYFYSNIRIFSIQTFISKVIPLKIVLCTVVPSKCLTILDRYGDQLHDFSVDMVIICIQWKFELFTCQKIFINFVFVTGMIWNRCHFSVIELHVCLSVCLSFSVSVSLSLHLSSRRLQNYAILWISIYLSIYLCVLIARISVTFSYHSFLSSIALGRSSLRNPVFAQIWCI